MDLTLISPVTDEITQCMDQSDDQPGLLEPQLKKKQTNKLNQKDQKCISSARDGWMSFE